MAAGLLRGVCGCTVCVGDMVPQISITGSRAGVSSHPKDAGTLEVLGPNSGRDGRGKRKSASAHLTNSWLAHIEPGREITIAKLK